MVNLPLSHPEQTDVLIDRPHFSRTPLSIWPRKASVPTVNHNRAPIVRSLPVVAPVNLMFRAQVTGMITMVRLKVISVTALIIVAVKPGTKAIAKPEVKNTTPLTTAAAARTIPTVRNSPPPPPFFFSY